MTEFFSSIGISIRLSGKLKKKVLYIEIFFHIALGILNGVVSYLNVEMLI